MRKSLLFAIAALVLLPTMAFAQKQILTGSEKGAYNSTFCPPIPGVLDAARFPGYRCQTSGGTLANIAGVLDKPGNIGFVQLDVLAREMDVKPDLKEKLSIIRSDIACEGLWMVSKKPQSFGEVLGFARRTTFVIGGEMSGSAATFRYLQSIDPDGLGRAGNNRYPIKYVSDTSAMFDTINAGGNDQVGFFVQFADPENGNIKKLIESGLTVVPVVSNEIVKAKVAGQDLYSVQSFALTAGGLIASGVEKITSCTPVALVTANPAVQKDANVRDDQKDLIQAVQSIPSSKLLPQESRLAKLISGAKKLSASAVNDMVALAEKAKQGASATFSGGN